jgi:hypothetical protein
MKLHPIVAATVALGLLSGAALAQTSTMPQPATDAKMSTDGKRVRITYENLTTGQTFSPSVFVSHDANAPELFKEGEKASFGLMRIAEEGNAGPLLSDAVAKNKGGHFGEAAQGVSVLPGKSRTVEISVTREHPMLSGAWMLVMTNDGFTGISGVNAYEMTATKTMDLMAYEAGTEKNNEKKAYLVAMMGTSETQKAALSRSMRAFAATPTPQPIGSGTRQSLSRGSRSSRRQ